MAADYRENQRRQADREQCFPVVVVAEIVGWTTEGGRTEQLQEIASAELITPRNLDSHRRVRIARKPGAHGQLRGDLDGRDADR